MAAYWAELLAARGYEVVDCLREPLREDERVEWWYAQNLLVFGRTGGAGRAARQRDHPRRGVRPLSLVHPRRM